VEIWSKIINHLKKLTMAKTSKIALISARAKKIWKKGSEKWTDAISRASKELKKEGKI
jgi:hypothetical protein